MTTEGGSSCAAFRGRCCGASSGSSFRAILKVGHRFERFGGKPAAAAGARERERGRARGERGPCAQVRVRRQLLLALPLYTIRNSARVVPRRAPHTELTSVVRAQCVSSWARFRACRESGLVPLAVERLGIPLAQVESRCQALLHCCPEGVSVRSASPFAARLSSQRDGRGRGSRRLFPPPRASRIAQMEALRPS